MREGIRFLLGNQARHLETVDPAMTVLRYLREVEHRVGTKEGCAEGDCGACTVAVGEASAAGTVFKAVNSCIQFVPMLDGRQLLTVEDLRRGDGEVHPVIAAMCAAHASQCGFCTPGVVMSLAAQHLNGVMPDRAGLKTVLTGNLCRCTGYGPILDAGERLAGVAPQPPEHADTLRAWAGGEGATVCGGGRRFYASASLVEFARLRLEKPEALIVCGLTDVGLRVTKQHSALPDLLYVGNVAELKALHVTDSHVEIGAAVTLAEAHDALGAEHRDLYELVRRFASLQIRNVATVCGNIANGSPIGDLAPPFIALGAELVLQRGGETRAVALEDFFLAYGRQDLGEGEFVARLRLPRLRGDRSFRCFKLSKRFDQDISAVCGAFCATLDGGTARDVRISFGGMAATPKRAPQAEAALEGAPWTRAAVAAAMVALDGDYTPLADLRGTAAYRTAAARNLLLKFFVETSGDTVQTRVLDYREVAHG
jgi:xanthine dehydrogenase small subunit